MECVIWDEAVFSKGILHEEHDFFFLAGTLVKGRDAGGGPLNLK